MIVAHLYYVDMYINITKYTEIPEIFMQYENVEWVNILGTYRKAEIV